MHRTERRKTTNYYRCEECGLSYADKKIAEQCRAWCAEHKSCNIEIITHAKKDPDAR